MCEVIMKYILGLYRLRGVKSMKSLNISKGIFQRHARLAYLSLSSRDGYLIRVGSPLSRGDSPTGSTRLNDMT